MRPAFAAILAAALLPTVAAHADPLDDAKGHARPVVVLSDSRDDPRVAKQISALDGTRPELTNRNIQVLQEADGKGPLHKKLGVEEKGLRRRARRQGRLGEEGLEGPGGSQTDFHGHRRDADATRRDERLAFVALRRR